MAPSSHLQDSLKALSMLLKISSIDCTVLVVQAFMSLLVDPYLSETMRGLLAISVASQSVIQQPNLIANLLTTLVFFYFEAEILSRPGGLLVAIGQLWIQTKIVPLLWAYIRAKEIDARILGELINASLPLACFSVTILSFKYIAATLELLWFCATDPGLWFIGTLAIGCVNIWNDVLTKNMKSFLTTQIFSRIKHSFVSFSIATFRFSLIPYRYLGRLEYYIVANRHNDEIKLRPKYSYRKLEIGYIRLLKVQRRIPFSGLHCQIIHVPLSQAPPYEAVSYCWGTDPPTKIVRVDGRSMMVLDTVHEVLHYRYSFRQEKLLWIDSVCINQKDDVEKGKQIQLMRTIFSKAVGVLAWIGGMEYAIIARSFIITLGAKVELFGQTPQDLLNEYKDSDDMGWKYLAILLSKQWFTRSWMLQEIALAKQIQLVFGGQSVEWENFAKALPIICDPLLGRFLGSSDAEYEIIRPMLGATNATIMAAYRTMVQENTHVTLDETLQISLTFQATKGHDKIYSVLGLVTDGSIDRIKPDYRKSVEQVFTETMRSILRSDAPLASLHLAGTGTLRNHKLPSWVPDWTNSEAHVWNTGRTIIYNAGTRFSPKVFVPSDNNAPFIRVGGNLVDEIIALGRVGPFGAEELGLREKDLISRQEHLLVAWLVEGKKLAAEHSRSPYFVGTTPRRYQSRDEAFWRTIIADKTSNILPAPPECAEGYAVLEWFLGISPDSKPGSVPPIRQLSMPEKDMTIPKRVLLQKATVLNTFLYHIGAGSLGRRIAVTKTGLLAVVPQKARKGDLTLVVWGTQTPYLMRPKDMKISGEQCFELVGSCFVHGLMEGEGADGNGTMFTLV